MLFKLNKNQALSQLSDEELIVRVKTTGKTDAVGELYNRYAHLVYGICLKYLKHREESKDIAMNVFEKMISLLPNSEVQFFKNWLYTITKNQCLSYLRGKNKRIDQTLNWEELEKKSVPFMENEDHLSLINKELEEKRVQVALARLKPDQKKCMEMFFYKDMSYKEIENKTGYTLKQVKSFLQNGKRNLKLILESKL